MSKRNAMFCCSDENLIKDLMKIVDRLGCRFPHGRNINVQSNSFCNGDESYSFEFDARLFVDEIKRKIDFR